jgi:hypothetical protein
MIKERLRVKYSDFKTDLTYNEWVEQYRVSSGYIEPTKYYQGNAGSPKMSMDTLMELQISRKTSGDDQQNLIGKILSLISF